MGSDLHFVEHVRDQASGAGEVTFRKMFGEFAIYLDGKVVALVCDNQLFVKPTEGGSALLTDPPRGSPYPGARPHLMLNELLDDRHRLAAVLRATADALPMPVPRKKR